MLCERLLAILVEEELGIRKACTQNALISVRDHVQMFSPSVAHGDEYG